MPSDVDPDRSALRDRPCDLALGLDRNEPFAAGSAHGDVAHGAGHIAAVAVAQPAELRQQQPAIRLVEPDLFRIRVAKGVVAPLLPEAGKAGATGEEVAVRPLQVLERLLQRMHGCQRQPRRLRAVPPCGELSAQRRVAEPLLAALVACLLERQRLVEHEPAAAGEALHPPCLLAVRHQLVPEGLPLFHGGMIDWPMKRSNEIRRGRHCVFAMHVHLVFVTKYVFDADAIGRLHAVFTKVCAGR